MSFADYTAPHGYFDAVIGNPPFGAEKLYDPNRKDLSKFSIHNYFFAKSLDYVRPGGVIAFVTSAYSSYSACRQYYDDLAAAFGLTIERVGPHFGTEYLLDVLADSSTLANLAGERTRLLWPDHYDLRRIPIRHPTPVYPSSLIWHQDNPHPDLRTLLDYLALARVKRPESEIWIPSWAQP